MICNAGFGYYGTVEETPADVMQRMMDVNFMGTFYGARAALPIFRAQNSGHLIFVSSIVGRRGHRADERLQRDQGGAGRASPSRCATEFAGTPIHVSVRLPDLDARPSSSTRWRATSATRSAASDPKQSVDDVARAIVALHPDAAARGLSARGVARADVLTPSRPRFTDRLVGKYGRRREIR